VVDSESAECYNDQGATSSRKRYGAVCTNWALGQGTDEGDELEQGRRSAGCNAQERGHKTERGLYEIA
jgi:hypothetical protein